MSLHSHHTSEHHHDLDIVPLMEQPDEIRHGVEELHRKLIKDRIFLPRSPSEEKIIAENHQVWVDHHGKPLAGASIIPVGADQNGLRWHELTRMWSDVRHPKPRLTAEFVSALADRVKQDVVFAVTNQPRAYSLFQRSGFQPWGLAHELKNRPVAPYLPERIANYPDDRNDAAMLVRWQPNSGNPSSYRTTDPTGLSPMDRGGAHAIQD